MEKYKYCKIIAIKDNGSEITKTLEAETPMTTNEWRTELVHKPYTIKEMFCTNTKENTINKDEFLFLVRNYHDAKLIKAFLDVDKVMEGIPKLLEEYKTIQLWVYKNGEENHDNFLFTIEFGVFDTETRLKELKKRLNNV